ncbi:hypothetical protein C8R48DRAFT_750837 [Suillus tomentosus]|nr:hypothetical protein C8R48DRAFT_750837 [Suillus tomentosus]
MTQEQGFKDSMFAWLENIISCELPNDVGCVFETCPQDAKKPVRRSDEMDPRLETLPQIAELDAQSFAYEFREFLTRLAVECNWHHIRSGEKRGDENCRMRLDGSLQDITTIDVETGSIELRRWRARINNYTDLILFLMQSNTDTQFIGSGEAAKAAVFYITEYITKSSLPMYIGIQALEYATKMHEQKFEALEDVTVDQKNRNLITKSVNAMMGQQEISHQQVMSYLVGGGDFYTSHTFQTLRWYEFVQAADRLDREMTYDENEEPCEESEDSTIQEEQVTVNVMADGVEVTSDIEDYALRPITEHQFADLSLWEFVEKTSYLYCWEKQSLAKMVERKSMRTIVVA